MLPLGTLPFFCRFVNPFLALILLVRKVIYVKFFPL